MASYPLLGSPAVIASQYPYTEIDEHVVSQSSLDCGASFTFYENPSVMRRFTLEYPLIVRTDLDTLITFFDANRGGLGEFSFTDDQGTTWTKTSFDQDRLQPGYPNPHQYSLQVKLRAQP